MSGQAWKIRNHLNRLEGMERNTDSIIDTLRTERGYSGGELGELQEAMDHARGLRRVLMERIDATRPALEAAQVLEEDAS